MPSSLLDYYHKLLGISPAFQSDATNASFPAESPAPPQRYEYPSQYPSQFHTEKVNGGYRVVAADGHVPDDYTYRNRIDADKGVVAEDKWTGQIYKDNASVAELARKAELIRRAGLNITPGYRSSDVEDGRLGIGSVPSDYFPWINYKR